MTTTAAELPLQSEDLGWRRYADVADDRLVALIRASNALAFEALMRRHNRRLFRIAVSVLRDADAAQDAVQETYIRAFTRLETYVPCGKFGAWLARVAFNEALMQRRRCAATVPLDALDVGTEHTHAGERPLALSDRVAESLSARMLLEQAVHALPDVFRPVFVLRKIEGLSVAETAECLGLPAATVRTRMHRAQRLMRLHIVAQIGDQAANAFEFAGARCDRVVAGVLAAVTQPGAPA